MRDVRYLLKDEESGKFPVFDGELDRDPVVWCSSEVELLDDDDDDDDKRREKSLKGIFPWG